MADTKSLVLLGSTGSIGVQALEVAQGAGYRVAALAAGSRVKDEGKDNDLLERIAADPAFGLTREQILRHLDPADYIGCCPEQVERFLRDCIQPVLEKYAGALAGHSAEITV